MLQNSYKTDQILVIFVWWSNGRDGAILMTTIDWRMCGDHSIDIGSIGEMAGGKIPHHAMVYYQSMFKYWVNK